MGDSYTVSRYLLDRFRRSQAPPYLPDLRLDKPHGLSYSWDMRALLVHNPAAGQRDATRNLHQAVDLLATRGWQVELRHTRAPGDASTMAREAAEQAYDMVVAVGGDGTLREVVSGLAGSQTVVGMLPVGTGNVWARNLGIPFWTPTSPGALREAARILLEGAIHWVDLGSVDGHHFLLHAGIGFDAQVAQEVEPRRSQTPRGLRNLGYFASAAGTAFSMRGRRVTITIDGRTMRQRAIMILVLNAQFYAGSFNVAPRARLDDGMLDVYVFKGSSALDTLGHIAKLMLGLHAKDPHAEFYHARQVDVRSGHPLPVQADGDPLGETPVSIRIVPRALRVVVPRQVSRALFQSPASGAWARA